jgi:hypothetical protein
MSKKFQKVTMTARRWQRPPLKAKLAPELDVKTTTLLA